MNWDTFFEDAENVTAEETRQFIESGEPDRYQLVDVRQPKEYEQTHIPGAILLPLAELADRYTELNADKPVIVYCRSGVRSKAASQILNQAGVKYVFNMTGGMISWQGAEAEGGTEAGLELFANGDFPSTFELAYQMENGLRSLYQTLAENAELSVEKELLLRLAEFENGHMARLSAKYGSDGGHAKLDVIEGGFDTGKMIEAFGDQLHSVEQVLQLGMKLEAQAFDLYRRLAWKHQGAEVADFYQEMAADEQRHLLQLSRELDRLLEDAGAD